MVYFIKEIFVLNIIFVAVCFFIQLRNVQTPGVVAHHSSLHFTSEEDKVQSTEPFELRSGPNALAVSLRSTHKPGAWFDASILNIKDKSKYIFTINSNRDQRLLSNIPSGLYVLNFYKPKSVDKIDIEVNALSGAKSWSNFILAVFAICIPSLYVYIVDQMFSLKRRRARLNNQKAPL